VQVTPVTGTPFSILPPPVARPVAISDETLTQIEWAAALDVVAGFAAGPLGAARVRGRRPSADLREVHAALSAVAELAGLLRRNDPFRVEPVADLTSPLNLLALPGGVLDGPGLHQIARALRAMRLVAGEVRRVADAAPAVGGLLRSIPPRDLERDLERAIAPDGSVQDEASPRLKRARAAVREVRARLVRLLEDVLRRLSASERAADAGVTVRSGRYVIPVRRDARSRVSGIVHGESASGTTVFVEPEAAVELANELAGAEAEEAREVQRVLRELSEQARRYANEIGAGWEMCIAADDLFARARYMVATDAVLPEVRESPAPFRIRDGRHPLLLASERPVVPFDLALEPERPVLVISGPNAGGKTVLLKAVGLLAALVQSGIVPPVGEGTVFPLFTAIFADIGDHQSIAESLSTFSARVRALRDVLVAADSRGLVLLDELGAGTDPTEGAALAGACVLELGRRGVVALVTTHLDALKDVAARSPHLQNGALEFDAASLTPTFRLVQGAPGRSYGLVVARRLGLPEPILAEAEALVPEAHRSLDAALSDVEARSRALAGRSAAVEAEAVRLDALREALESARAALEERQAEVERRERDLERSGREQARRFLLEARRRVDDALGVARAAVSEATAREARRLVEEGVKQEAEALKKLDEAARAKGWRVSGAPAGPDGAGPRAARTVKQRVETNGLAAAASFEIDLRGMSGDEAETALGRAIDRAVMDDLPHLRVIHGKGTGALRARVHQLARRDARVSEFRLGLAEEGGTGVTILELAR
jgi:DNA mismatch repair protein MutS2